MKTFRKSFLALAVGLSMLLSSSSVFAQSTPEPAIIVSVAKIKEQLSDINYLMDAAGYGQMAFLVKVQAEQFLKGVDNDRPAGVMMFFEEDADEDDEPKALAFVPMDNLDDFLTTISEYAEIDEQDEMTTIITGEDDELFLKESNGFAFLTDSKELFEAIPADPEKMLGDLPNRFNVSAKVFGQRVPESLRQMAFDTLREQSEQQLEMRGNIDPVQAELQRQNLELSMERMESLVEDLEILELGFQADEEGEAMNFGFKVTSKDGSTFANLCNLAAEAGPSKFAGLKMANSAFNSIARMKIDPDDLKYEDQMAQSKDAIIKGLEEEEVLSDDDMETAKDVIDQLSDVVLETLKSGELDSGSVVMMSEGKANLVAGMRIADPDKFEAAVKDAVGLAEKQDGLSEFFDANLNSGSHEGYRLHTITVNIPEDEEEMYEIFGGNATVLVGIGKEDVFIAAGTEPMSLLKQAIDSSATPAKVENQVEYNLFLTPILRFAAGIESNEALEMMADKMEEVGKDRMTFSAKMIKNGLEGSFQMKDGVFALIEVAGEAFGAGGGGFGDDF